MSCSSDCTECGHSYESHGDIAIYPPCEAGLDPWARRHKAVASMYFGDIPQFLRETACFCRAFRHE